MNMGVAVALDELELWLCVGGGVVGGVGGGGVGEGTTATLVGAAVLGAVVVGGIEGWGVGRLVGGGVVAGGGAPNKANFVVSLGPVHAPPLAKTSPSGNNVTV